MLLSLSQSCTHHHYHHLRKRTPVTGQGRIHSHFDGRSVQFAYNLAGTTSSILRGAQTSVSARGNRTRHTAVHLHLCTESRVSSIPKIVSGANARYRLRSAVMPGRDGGWETNTSLGRTQEAGTLTPVTTRANCSRGPTE